MARERSEQWKEYNRNLSRERYRSLRAAELCVDCRAQLEPGNGVRCSFCHDVDLARQSRRNRTPSGRATKRRYLRAKRKEWERDGACLYCGGETSGKKLCERHRLEHNERTRMWRLREKERRAAPDVVANANATTTTDPLLDARYVPIDEVDSLPRVRLLKAMRWLDWSTVTDLCHVLNVDLDPWAPEHNNLQQTIGRMVKYELVEKRLLGKRKLNAEYRLTDAGRAEADRIRNGGTVSLRRLGAA